VIIDMNYDDDETRLLSSIIEELTMRHTFPIDKEFEPFHVNKPSSYRKRNNWYLRFRHHA